MLKTGFLVDRQRAWCIHKLIDVEQLQIHMQIALFMACIWNAQKLSPDRNVFESFECFECFEWRCQMSCKWRVSLYLCLIPLLSKFSSIDWFATVGNNFGADQSICYTRNDSFYSCFFFFFWGYLCLGLIIYVMRFYIWTVNDCQSTVRVQCNQFHGIDHETFIFYSLARLKKRYSLCEVDGVGCWRANS